MTKNGSSVGETAWGWLIRGTGLLVFVHQAVIRDKDVNFGIAFLAISAAVFPIREFAGFLKSWWSKRGDAP